LKSAPGTARSAKLAFALASALLALAPLTPARAEMPDSDPKAVAIADQVMKALGGKDRWDKLPGLRWTWEVSINDTIRSSRRHSWDKMHGWQRVEGKTRSGDAYVYITQLDGPGTPHAWVNGTAIEGDSLQKLAARSRSLWINDSYWFLMPYKLRDPGVHLKMVTDTTIDNVMYQRITLSFEKVGDTPGDRYWVYVNPKNHRVERWEHLLQGSTPPPVMWTWEGWEEHDGLWFPTAHRQPGRAILTGHVETMPSFAPGTFEQP
jgi:hypothetical protein